MDSRQRGLSHFTGSGADRLPMWYMGAPETTGNIIKYLGAGSEEEALYGIRACAQI